MQGNRLFEITYILLEQGNVTAKELAERFEVSQRTIYRDIDTLSAAGVPVYCNKGRGGGIRLLNTFVLDRALFSEEEQAQLMAGLQSLQATALPNLQPVLDKISGIFGQRNSWLEVDFTAWGWGRLERELFLMLQQAVLEKKQVSFRYYGANGTMSQRTVEPLKLVFKGSVWYLYGYCLSREDTRVFRLSRMRDAHCTGEVFERDIPQDIYKELQGLDEGGVVHLKLKVDKTDAFRVYDAFEPEQITPQPDGNFQVELDFPQGKWVYQFLLSLGNHAEVLEPAYLREEMRGHLEQILSRYE